VLERHSKRMAEATPLWHDAKPLPSERHTWLGCGVFAAYPIEGWVAAVAERTPALRTIDAQHVVLCVGARDPSLPIVNGDRPGVVAARGLARTLKATGRRPTGRVVVVGDGEHARACAEALDAGPPMSPTDVRRIAGSDRVRSIETHAGQIPCELVALAAPPAPTHELPAQLGASVEFDGTGFAVVRDDRGRCGTFAHASVWAAGDVAGYVGPDAAYADGRRIGESVASTVEKERVG